MDPLQCVPSSLPGAGVTRVWGSRCHLVLDAFLWFLSLVAMLIVPHSDLVCGFRNLQLAGIYKTLP